MRYLISSLILFCYTAVIAQNKAAKKLNKLAVNRVDSIVKSIVSDTTISWQIVEKPAKNRVQTTEKKFPAYTIVSAGYKNGEMVVLQYLNGKSIILQDSYSHVFYFDKGKPIMFIEQYSNSSRMGSCGQISVSFCHYLNDSAVFAGLAKSATGFYSCYGYKLAKPVYSTLTEEIENFKKILKREGVSQETKKNQYFFFTAFSQQEIQERYGF